MTLNNFLQLHKDGCAQDCISIHQLPYDYDLHTYAQTFYEECRQEDVLQSDTFEKIKNAQVDHFNIIGGGIYDIELCIYLTANN